MSRKTYSSAFLQDPSLAWSFRSFQDTAEPRLSHMALPKLPSLSLSFASQSARKPPAYMSNRWPGICPRAIMCSATCGVPPHARYSPRYESSRSPNLSCSISCISVFLPHVMLANRVLLNPGWKNPCPSKNPATSPSRSLTNSAKLIGYSMWSCGPDMWPRRPGRASAPRSTSVAREPVTRTVQW